MFPYCHLVHYSEFNSATSALGHSRHSECSPDTSALPPISDVMVSRSKRRPGPISDIGIQIYHRGAGVHWKEVKYYKHKEQLEQIEGIICLCIVLL
jgi:hypothetical protein